MNTHEPGDRNRIINRIMLTTLVVNIVLMLIKFGAYLLGGSGAMLSDAVNTLSDVGTTLLVLTGMRMGGKARDEEHPYGHEKLETLTGLLLAVVLVLTALGIGAGGLRAILSPPETPEIPTLVPLAAAVISILTQECMYRYARWGGKKIQSTAMLADAWHHRSDALSSIGSFIGILGARMGYPVMDALASLAICGAILWAGVRIGLGAARQLIDTAAPQGVQDHVREIIEGTPGVLHIDELRTRQHANRLYIDAEIAVVHTMSFEAAHRVSEAVHRNIETACPDVLHCTVHANPHHGDGTQLDDDL